MKDQIYKQIKKNKEEYLLVIVKILTKNSKKKQTKQNLIKDKKCQRRGYFVIFTDK